MLEEQDHKQWKPPIWQQEQVFVCFDCISTRLPRRAVVSRNNMPNHWITWQRSYEPSMRSDRTNPATCNLAGVRLLIRLIMLLEMMFAHCDTWFFRGHECYFCNTTASLLLRTFKERPTIYKKTRQPTWRHLSWPLHTPP